MVKNAKKKKPSVSRVKKGKTGPKGPTKKKVDCIAKLIEAFKNDFTIKEACARADINESTYHRRIKSDKKLCNEIEAAKQWPFMVAKNCLGKGIAVSPKIALSWLSKRQKDIYSDRKELTGADGAAINLPVTKEEQQDINDILKINS